MKRVLVLSDSHGNIENMRIAVRDVCPDLIIHLGDCYSDAEHLHENFKEIPMYQVPGNCDYWDEELEKEVEIEGYNFLLCHGHTFNVKMDEMRLQYAAEEREMDVALFGHTHRVFYSHHNGIRLYNPGSIGAPLAMNPPSYGIITIDGANSKIKFDTIYME